MASVYAFQPRKFDPPHFVAETLDDALDLTESFIGGEQCDGCGNHTYEVQLLTSGRLVAVCKTDPDESEEFRHPEPCGHQWPITLWEEDLVAF